MLALAESGIHRTNRLRQKRESPLVATPTLVVVEPCPVHNRTSWIALECRHAQSRQTTSTAYWILELVVLSGRLLARPSERSPHDRKNDSFMEREAACAKRAHLPLTHARRGNNSLAWAPTHPQRTGKSQKNDYLRAVNRNHAVFGKISLTTMIQELIHAIFPSL